MRIDRPSLHGVKDTAVPRRDQPIRPAPVRSGTRSVTSHAQFAPSACHDAALALSGSEPYAFDWARTGGTDGRKAIEAGRGRSFRRYRGWGEPPCVAEAAGVRR